jgi:hypothetical protein
MTDSSAKTARVSLRTLLWVAIGILVTLFAVSTAFSVYGRLAATKGESVRLKVKRIAQRINLQANCTLRICRGGSEVRVGASWPRCAIAACRVPRVRMARVMCGHGLGPWKAVPIVKTVAGGNARLGGYGIGGPRIMSGCRLLNCEEDMSLLARTDARSPLQV